jgi:hypothetical protein
VPALAENVLVVLQDIHPRPKTPAFRADFPYRVTRVATIEALDLQPCAINPREEEVFEVAQSWVTGPPENRQGVCENRKACIGQRIDRRAVHPSRFGRWWNRSPAGGKRRRIRRTLTRLFKQRHESSESRRVCWPHLDDSDAEGAPLDPSDDRFLDHEGDAFTWE